MVKAVQVNSLGFVEWLLRIRPGVAISLALHIALLLFLAIMLAFPPSDPPAPANKDVVIDMTVPPAPPAPRVQINPLIKPMAIEQLKTVAEVPPLIIPVFPKTKQAPPTEVTAKEPPPVKAAPPEASPPVIDQPHALYRGGLVFPSRAVEREVSGYVDFSFIIEPDGSVGDPEVTAETPEGYGFAAAALNAFRSWRFEPKRIDGNPVAAQARYRISFKLE